jgi:protein-L-isoaspartate(D-aspartate) O-methyltransferase
MDDSLPISSATSGAAGDSTAARHAMVETQLRSRGILDRGVLAAMQRVPRHEFVPPESRASAYADEALPIDEGQTISQPYIVAVMTAALHLTGTERVLEIGTGCGYQAAVLSLLAREVFCVECAAPLAQAARERLARLGYANVRVFEGDGALGLPQFAPFDGILIAAAAPAVPAPLLEQLAEGGRLILPVGEAEHQQLKLLKRTGNTLLTRSFDRCRFVPLLGRYGWREMPPA